ncbi:HAMP domain-containing sensor histidine kinase [Vibrio sp. TH_r3]|uniref:sensor histidine kinase n=1 Tax=Vibrio sp. TH_r3 TaxID=3082084 RepID=UPI00295584A9|nr:HAMP domain-containing sensor histidine kinase [Vibrio sp. TH_r3]MDV7105973.1 HAMP domain-containing sensor histidine kinase [Vibrio sp. TH_r3]
MKIRPSLKIRFVAGMILLASVMTLFFSVLTLDYFFQGMDRGQAQTMRDFANVEGVQEGQLLDVMGYQVSARWQDIPPRVKEMFDNKPPEQLTKIAKQAKGGGFFSPPTEMYFVMKALNRQGEVRYIAKSFLALDDLEGIEGEKRIRHLIWLIVVAMSVIAAFTFGLFFMIRKVTRPVESLKNWAKALDEESLKQPAPDFQYGELNTLADIIQSSLSSVQQSVEREQQFLSHASHELRTPISVIRANTELLQKVCTKEQSSAKQIAILKRIDRAGKTMTHLTETLLWLSRDDSNLPQSETINLQDMIDELVTELGYLIKGKSIELHVDTSDYVISSAVIPCRIVLANLIRNAFQHTTDGKVIVIQNQGSVTVTNSSHSSTDAETDLGFGLGLSLTKKLAARYGWQYSNHRDEYFYTARIKLV